MRGAGWALLGVLLGMPGTALGATVADVLRTPARYEGKVVRLKGFVDQCTPYECHLCPTPGLPDVKTCLVLDGWAHESSVDPDDYEGVQAAERASLLLDEFYRFTGVTVRARVDVHTAREIAASHEVAPEFEALIDHFGCGSTRRCHEVDEVFLTEVAVEKLSIRGSAFDGPLTGAHAEPLVPLSEADDAAVREAFASRNYGQLRPAGARTYGHPEYSSAWICTGPIQWPERLGQVARSPANEHRCWEASRSSLRSPYQFYGDGKPFSPD